ncbi:MAG: AI-2E family transporter [Eubacterium sp.]|nr:AI-2E family transporter [Eubacterium sp.]
MKEKLLNLLEKRWFAYMLATCSAVLLYLILSHISGILGWADRVLDLFAPLIVGAVLAYLLNPLVRIFERVFERVLKKEKPAHLIAVALSVILLLALVGGLFAIIIPNILTNLTALVGSGEISTTYYLKFMNFIEGLLEESGINFDQIFKTVSSGIAKNAGSVKELWANITMIGSAMGNFMIGALLAVYFLLERDLIVRAITRLRKALLPEKIYERNSRFWRHCDEVFIRYIGFSFIDAVIIATANMVFMGIMGMPYVALVSAVVGITNLLPTIGPVIGAVIGGLILALNNPFYALIFLAFTLVLQALDAYVIKPKLFGDSMGIPPFLTLVAIILGGKMFGIAGIFLAIPAMSVIHDLYNNQLLVRLEARREKENAGGKEELTDESDQ